MTGIRSQEEILKAFEDLEYVPGSKQKRKDPTDLSKKRRAKILNESNGWDENPIKKILNGVETEMFTISALALALEKQIVTIRLWEKKGYIPASPYRLRSKILNEKKVSGNRVYTRELIEIAIEEFEKRNLLGSARVEWKKHEDLTKAIEKQWSEVVYNK